MRVVAGAAIEHVVAGIAGQDVVERVAGAVDGGRCRSASGSRHWRQRVADAALDRVGAFAELSVDHVAGVVDHIGIVAGAADQRVVAGAAVEHVAAGVAGEDVVERVAGAVDGGRAGQRQVLDIGAERVGDDCSAPCRCLRRQFSVTTSPAAVDDVGVVAGAADQGVVAGAAVEDVVAGVAGERRCRACCRCR